LRDYEEVDSGYEKPCSNPRTRIELRLGLGFRAIFRRVLGVGRGIASEENSNLSPAVDLRNRRLVMDRRGERRRRAKRLRVNLGS
jgi:hypothetical protein